MSNFVTGMIIGAIFSAALTLKIVNSQVNATAHSSGYAVIDLIERYEAEIAQCEMVKFGVNP